jgi:ribonucleoside-diphosphate reductase alpha chain
MNNLWYCETIEATNPCAEQPLPPFGACLLGSFNLVKYVTESRRFDFDQFEDDIKVVHAAMDNVIDKATYPLPQQRKEALNKRRMGLGVTGMANTIEAMGARYGDENYIQMQNDILEDLNTQLYVASALRAKEKEPFPLFSREQYIKGKYIQTLPPEVRRLIAEHGIRNSHLTSIAPTGTISLTADNVSSGIEPVFSYGYDRTIQTFDGPITEYMTDYGYREFNVEGKKTEDCTADDHVNVLINTYKHVDSAVSKTCNVSPKMAWEDFKNIYLKAWEGGAKGCTTFNPGGKRGGIFHADEDDADKAEALACYIDENGTKTCDE